MRARIARVLLPARNRRDLDEVPAEGSDRPEFVFPDNVDDALRNAMAAIGAACSGTPLSPTRGA